MNASAPPLTASGDAADRLTKAHIVPFAVFMGFMIVLQLVAAKIGWDHPDAPWWRRDPAHFIYPVQTLTCLGLLWFHRKWYRFDWSWKWLAPAVLFGAAGIGFWLLCATLPLIGLGDVLSKRLTRDLSPLALTVGRSVYGALFLVLFTPFLGLEGVGGPVEWFALAAAGLLQGVGVWTLYRAMQGGKASLVAALVAAAPLATLSAESAFLGLDLAPVQWIGLGIVLAAAGWLAVGEGRR